MRFYICGLVGICKRVIANTFSFCIINKHRICLRIFFELSLITAIRFYDKNCTINLQAVVIKYYHVLQFIHLTTLHKIPAVLSPKSRCIITC